MPRITGRDLAGHLTQAYRTYDGTTKTFTDPDVKNIEFFYSAVGSYLDEHEGSPEMNELYSNLGSFTSKLRECSDDINHKKITSKTLDEKQEELGSLAVKIVNGLKNFKGEEKELIGKYKQHIDKMECKKAGAILHASGEQKSAAKWIEEIKKGVKTQAQMTPEKVAQIFAARQLANATFGKRANIDNNKLTMAEIQNQAHKLMGSPEFKKYAEEVLPFVDFKTMDHGHGGRLEKTFENYLVEHPTKEAREFDLHGRYQEAVKPVLAAESDWVNVDYEMAGVQDPKTPKLVPEQEYRDYSDYIKKNAGKPVVGSKLAQAAKMAAANELSRKKPEDPFDKKALQKKTQEFMKDKNFKIMVADKENVDKLLKGDFVGFATEAGDIKTSCDAMLDADGQLELNGYPTLSLDRLEERVEQNPDLKPIVDSVNKLLPGDDEKVKHSPEEVMDAVGTIVDYQNKHAEDSLGDKARDLHDTMRLLHELTKGRYINRIVDKQMEMVNSVRNYKPEHPSYMTRDKIEKEGLDAEKQAKIDLGIEEPAKNAPKGEKKVEAPEELNKGVDYGHGPVA